MVDVDLNKECAVAGEAGLMFPEIYVVKGGYKAIFEDCPDICTPASYLVRILSCVAHRCTFSTTRNRERIIVFCFRV